MLNKLFSLIGISLSPSGGGVVAACSQFAYTVGNLAFGTWVSEASQLTYITLDGNQVAIGTHLNVTRADGSGGYYTVDESFVYYSQGTYLATQSSGDYTVQLPSGNTYTVGGYALYYVADGVGGYSTSGSGGYQGSGTFLENYQGQNYYSNGGGGYYQQDDGSGYGQPSYPSYGTYAYSDGYTTYYHDGMGGYYSTYNPPSYPSYGTYAYTDGNYTYYHDGMGGYYSVYTEPTPSYPPSGEFLYSEGGSSDLTWSAPDGSTGTWSYSSWGCSYYANGSGGSYSQCGGYTQSYGTGIASGSYTYENGVDEWGNTYYSNGTWQINFDGNSGYYTNTY